MLINITGTRKQGSLELLTLFLECHARIRHFVALGHDAGVRTDASDEDRADACSRVERYFTQALPLHVADEEESLLPRLHACGSAEVREALEAMTHQHAEHEAKTHALIHASAAVRRSPPDLDRRATLTTAARDLELAFSPHLLLEETIIFPAIAASLTKETQAHILDELRWRRALPLASQPAPLNNPR